jgi:hypothetical protein
MFVTVARATANTIITSTRNSSVFLSSSSTAGSLLLFAPQQRRSISQTNNNTSNVAPLRITTRNNMNLFHLKHAAFMSFLASSSSPSASAWSLSPASVTMSSKRSIHYNNYHHQDPLFSRGRQQLTNSGITSSSKFSTLQSAVAEEDIETPSSSSSTLGGGGGRAYAKGNIVNTFRGGLVAVRIDDDLTDNIIKVAEAELKTTSNDDIIPEVVEKEINKNKGVVKPDALGKYLHNPFFLLEGCKILRKEICIVLKGTFESNHQYAIPL